MATSTSQKLPKSSLAASWRQARRRERPTLLRLDSTSRLEWFLLNEDRRSLLRFADGVSIDDKASPLANQIVHGDAVRARILRLAYFDNHADGAIRLDLHYERDGESFRQETDLDAASLHRAKLAEGLEITCILPVRDTDLPLVLRSLDLRLRFEFWELYRLAEDLESEGERELANWLMLMILCEIRQDEPRELKRVFKASMADFTIRGSDPYYIVSDLIALHRDGMDVRDYLEPATAAFASRSIDAPAFDVPESFLRFKLSRKIRFAAG